MKREEFFTEFTAKRFDILQQNSTDTDLDMVVRLHKNKAAFHISAPIDEEGSYGTIIIQNVIMGSVTITLDAGLWSFIVQCLDDQVLNLQEEYPDGDMDELIEQTRDAAKELRKHLEKEHN